MAETGGLDALVALAALGLGLAVWAAARGRPGPAPARRALQAGCAVLAAAAAALAARWPPDAPWAAHAALALGLALLGCGLVPWMRAAGGRGPSAGAPAGGTAEARAQRDVLVREVHHRIKNHLQGLVGLLRASARGRDPACRAALDLAAGRVHAIALVHGLQSADAREEVAVCHLVEAICRGMELVAPERPVRVEVAVRDGPARLDPGEAVPVALVVQELVLNAVKHARGEGAVRVRVSGTRSAVDVRISNPGRLAPAQAGSLGHSGTGLGLVRALLAPRGAGLRLAEDGHEVAAVLSLRPPVLVVG